MSVEVQTNQALAAYLASLGIVTPNPVNLATQALEKEAKEKAEQRADALAGILGSAKAKIESAAISKFDFEKKAAEQGKIAEETSRAMIYLLSTGNDLPLRKNLGLPVRKDMEDQAKIPEGWTPPAAAA